MGIRSWQNFPYFTCLGVHGKSFSLFNPYMNFLGSEYEGAYKY